MRTLLTLLFLIVCLHLKAQTYNALRASAGYHGAFFTELGFSRVFLDQRGFGSTACFYGSLEENLKQEKPNVHGVKAGAEACLLIFYYGAEFKYLTDFSENSYILNLRAGLSGGGSFTLAYGYNIMDRYAPFPFITPHQVSLTANFNRKFWKDVWR